MCAQLNRTVTSHVDHGQRIVLDFGALCGNEGEARTTFVSSILKIKR